MLVRPEREVDLAAHVLVPGSSSVASREMLDPKWLGRGGGFEARIFADVTLRYFNLHTEAVGQARIKNGVVLQRQCRPLREPSGDFHCLYSVSRIVLARATASPGKVTDVR